MKSGTVKLSEITKHPTMRMDPKYLLKTESEIPLRIKVRFNLGRGKNYMKWKIQSRSGVEYHLPEDIDLIMKNCQLKNNRKVAEKIFNGENKDVCAWILCESITIRESVYSEKEREFFSSLSAISGEIDALRYNPRKNPFWTLNGDCVDNNSYKELYTIGKNIFIQKF